MSLPPTSPPPPQPTPVERFFGWLLVAVGGLMALLCGACTLTFWGVSFFGAIGGQPDALGAMAGLFVMVAIIGGLPTVGGVVLVWAGWRIVHPKTPPRPDVTKTFE
jgi:hypothetical protein